jgi:hypothetical protein
VSASDLRPRAGGSEVNRPPVKSKGGPSPQGGVRRRPCTPGGGVHFSYLEYRVDPLRVRVYPCGGREYGIYPPGVQGSSGRVQVTLGENLNSFACAREGAPAGLSGGGSTVDSPIFVAFFGGITVAPRPDFSVHEG